MSAESGPSMESIKSFNGEVLSRGFLLAEQFRKSGVLGEKKDDNERDKANEEVRRILNTSFVVGKVAETQVQPIIDFNSVSNMVNIARNEGLSDFLRQRANNALYETGLALSLDKTVFKAATEGNLDEVVPSNLHGIEPYILSSYLTTGRDDKDGQELVKELVNVFRLKKRADSDPGYFKKDFEEKTKDLFGKLLDKYDESTGEDESNGNVGRWETMMGYIKGIDDKTKREPVLTEMEEDGAARPEGSKKENESKADEEKVSGVSRELSGLKGKETAKKSYAQVKENDVLLELKENGIEGIYEKIEYIERGTSNVDDLSRNSDYFRFIYMISNGKFDDILADMSFEGKKLGTEGKDTLKKEIEMRMFLHNFYLAASKCHSIEDIVRVVGAVHEGDLDNSVDREFIRFFLEKRAGLKKIPINEAWDLRQKSYFQIDQMKKDIVAKKDDFLKYLNASGVKDDDAARKRIGLDKVEEWQIAQSTGLYGDNIEIKADRDYGIDKDIYKNFFQIEKGAGLDAKIIKEYMIWDMKKKTGCNDMDALKAFELAQKLSVATFANSKANIGFASDDYAEMMLFKFFRYTDSMTHSKDRERKSKSIGSKYTIRHIDTLVCHWLDLSRKDSVELRSIYNPLFSDQINFDRIVGNSDMPYHFSSIVATQVVPIKELFTDKMTPKDISGGNLNKIYAKINKLTYELCKAGIKPMYFGESKNDHEVYTKDSSKPYKIDNLSERKVAQKMRKVWLANLFYLMGDNSSGWTSMDLDLLIDSLLNNEQIIQDSGLLGGSFIPRQDIYELLDRTKVRRRVSNNDAEKREVKGRNTY